MFMKIYQNNSDETKKFFSLLSIDKSFNYLHNHVDENVKF